MAVGPNREVEMSEAEKVLLKQIEGKIDAYLTQRAGQVSCVSVSQYLGDTNGVLPEAVHQALVRAYQKAGWYNVLYDGKNKIFTLIATQEDESKMRDGA